MYIFCTGTGTPGTYAYTYIRIVGTLVNGIVLPVLSCGTFGHGGGIAGRDGACVVWCSCPYVRIAILYGGPGARDSRCALCMCMFRWAGCLRLCTTAHLPGAALPSGLSGFYVLHVFVFVRTMVRTFENVLQLGKLFTHCGKFEGGDLHVLTTFEGSSACALAIGSQN